MAEPFIDPNAPLQRLGGAVVDAFTAPIQPAAPGAMGALTMPGGAPPAPAGADAGFVPVPVVNPAQQPVPNSEAPWGPAPSDPRGRAAAAESGGDPWGPAPMPPGGAPFSAQPALIPSTTKETTTQTTGPDKATTANINAATADANAAATASGQAQIDQANATADLERRQSQEAFGRGVNDYFQRAGARQVEDEIIRETTARLEETAKFKPDRTQLFQGDTGLLFGISAAVAAMAGGWLMGQGLTGGKNPYLETVMRMIDDNANDQIQANSQVYQELTRRLGDAKAARHELTARMLESVNQTIEAKTRFEKADLVQRGAAAVLAETQKEIARNRLEAAKLTGKTTTQTVQSRTQMVPNPAATGGIDLTNPKEYATVGKVSALQNFATEVESAIKSGELSSAVGWGETMIGEFIDSGPGNLWRGPGRAKVDALKAAWETTKRAEWASEPNGQEVQRRLSLIAWPENDAEIPVFKQAVMQALNTADPGGRYRIAARALGQQPSVAETRRIPVVRGQ